MRSMRNARSSTDPAVFVILIEAAAETNASDKEDKTALMIAIQCSENRKVITALVEAETDVGVRSTEGWISLMLAANSNVNAPTEYDETGLMIATRGNNRPEVTTAPLSAGADVNARNEGNRTALMMVAGRNESRAVVVLLLNVGTNGFAVSCEGKTAVNYANENEAFAITGVESRLHDWKC